MTILKNNNVHRLNLEFESACKSIGVSPTASFIKIKNLLNSKPKKANIAWNNNVGLRAACFHGSVELVKYLMTSPDLEKHANISAKNYEGFSTAAIRGHMEVINYLIFDHHLDRQKEIRSILSTNQKIKLPIKWEIDKIIASKQLQENLSAALPETGIQKKMKI